MHPIIRTAEVFLLLTVIMLAIGAVIDLLCGFSYVFMIIMCVISVVSSVLMVWFSKSMALRSSKSHIITREEDPRLYGIVEKVAAEAGLPMPEVGISELPMPNAFATGRSPKNAAVVATRGLLNLLNDDELEGVFGHEMSHVKNRDILVMSATSTVVTILTYASQMFLFSEMTRDDRDNGAGLVIALLSYILVPFAGLLLQMGVSRSREYLADESGARITGKPLALASALRKLESGCQNPRNDYQDNAHANMWISNPISKTGRMFANLFSTHPSTDKRIARLEKIAEMMDSGECPPYQPGEHYGNHTKLSFE